MDFSNHSVITSRRFIVFGPSPIVRSNRVIRTKVADHMGCVGNSVMVQRRPARRNPRRRLLHQHQRHAPYWHLNPLFIPG